MAAVGLGEKAFSADVADEDQVEEEGVVEQAATGSETEAGMGAAVWATPCMYPVLSGRC